MLLREAEEKDIPDILRLLGEMDGESGPGTCEALDIFKKIRQYPYYKVLVAEAEEKVVGTCSLIILDNFGHNGAPLAVVEGVIVDGKYRGRGIGNFMMCHVMELAEKEKCYKLMLSSNKKRLEAHRFYQKLGFKQHGLSFFVEVNGND